MTAPNDRFWAKVFFRDFIKHYRKMTPEQIVADVEKSMDDLENLEESGTSFGAKMIRASIGRAENYPQASENGKKGGRPRKNPLQEENAEPDAEQPKAQPRTHEKSTAAPAAHAPAPAPKTAVKKPGQVVWGTFENVYLSQEEFNELARLVGNLNSTREMVDSFSAKLEDGSVTSANHYATLVYWANYRKSQAEKDADGDGFGRRYETVSEHNMRVSRQADVWIAEHFGKNKKEAVNG